jgi:chromosome segregation ATPase
VEIATAAFLLSVLSVVLSLVGLVRTRRTTELTSQIQLWSWRQKFLQSLSGLSHQVNQAEIALERELRRLDSVDEILRRVGELNPVPAAELQMLQEKVSDARVRFRSKGSDLAKHCHAIRALWQNSAPTADLDAVVQEQSRTYQNILDAVQADAIALEHRNALLALLNSEA